MKSVLAMICASSFAISPIPHEDAPLEPSIQNEVDHAVDLAEGWLALNAGTNSPSGDHFGTNGMTRTGIALKLLRLQRSGGYWTTNTNDAPTKLAVSILKGL